MKVNSHLFEAYLQCSTKCWLRSRAEPAVENSYAEWARAQNETYYHEGCKRLLATLPGSDFAIAPPTHKNFKDPTGCLATGVQLRTNDLVSRLQAVERVASEGRAAQLIPYRFEFLNRLTKEHKLLLAFDALLLSEVIGREVSLAKIVYGDGYLTLKVKTTVLISEVRKSVQDITTLLANDSPPDLVLNRHCGQCEFQARCRRYAVEKDELSLLSGISEKERKKLHGKGIFTVNQLSYTFRPRRRSARKKSQSPKHESALKALAIRMNRTHVVGSPTLSGPEHAVYFDVEGVPDRECYYLIGLRYRTEDKDTCCSFWADTPSDEREMWGSCLSALSLIDVPRLIHYGSYETQFLKRMKARYCNGAEETRFLDRLISSSVNLLSLTYAQAYFPTYSNGLKDIAGHLGFQWSDATASGLKALAWRSQWESSREPSLKQRLLTYNAEDCEAVQRVAEAIAAICAPRPEATGSSLETVNVHFLVERHKRMFCPPEFAVPEFRQINEAAYWDYQRSKVYVRSSTRMRHLLKKLRREPNKTRIDKVIQVCEQRPARCFRCGSTLIHKTQRRSQVILDMRFFSSGPRRSVIRYLYNRYRCRMCNIGATQYKRRAKYGGNLCAYVIYLMIEMRITQHQICEHLKELFGLHLNRRDINRIKVGFAENYKFTYEILLQHIAAGRLAHADETTVTVAGHSRYVWVFTNLEEVAYVYAESREAGTAQKILCDFRGVLVSDFYAGYDTVDCVQQKCLIHLMRDLNDDLHKQPFNEELKELASGFAALLQPMVKTIDQYGLKTRHLRKHRDAVKIFFDALSKRNFRTEVPTGYKKRLEKYQGKLFVFLEHDGIPWNNNNAEHAVKALIRLRNTIGGTGTSKSIQEYLVLLSVRETCKYQNVDFLDFLRSGSNDVGEFASRLKRRLGATK